MKYLILCLALLGCEAPNFGFLPCSLPAEVTEATEQPNAKGCWRLTSDQDHGFTLEDPGSLTCDSGSRCIVIVPGEKFWTLGVGPNKPSAEDVDCSEVCQ